MWSTWLASRSTPSQDRSKLPSTPAAEIQTWQSTGRCQKAIRNLHIVSERAAASTGSCVSKTETWWSASWKPGSSTGIHLKVKTGTTILCPPGRSANSVFLRVSSSRLRLGNRNISTLVWLSRRATAFSVQSSFLMRNHQRYLRKN